MQKAKPTETAHETTPESAPEPSHMQEVDPKVGVDVMQPEKGPVILQKDAEVTQFAVSSQVEEGAANPEEGWKTIQSKRSKKVISTSSSSFYLVFLRLNSCHSLVLSLLKRCLTHLKVLQK